MSLHEPAQVGPPPPRLGMTVQASSLLLCGLIAAAASTVALVIVAVIQANTVAAPGNAAPPSQAALIITAAVFVVSWIAVAFAFCRDQVLHRVTQMEASVASVAGVQHELRSDFAALRREMAEYAEQHETEGFLNGRRAAAPADGAPHTDGVAEVRHLHRVPPTP